MARYTPKSLAKTISYIAYHSPGEHGLFWDSNGTMPWKEFYWALQEDPELRFVRQSHILELNYLQIELPIELEGNLLRIRKGYPIPDYLASNQLPARMFYACPRKQFASTLRNGLVASGRRLLMLPSDKDLALRIGRRRDPKPLIIEVRAMEASNAGVPFLAAGPELFLVESIAADYLHFPRFREDDFIKLTTKKKDKAACKAVSNASSPGSFMVSPNHFQQAINGGLGAAEALKKRSNKKGPDWKREARRGKDRQKRTV